MNDINVKKKALEWVASNHPTIINSMKSLGKGVTDKFKVAYQCCFGGK